MFAQFYQKIWSEAYDQNDKNIISLLEKNPKANTIDIGCGDGQKTVKFKEQIGCKTIYGLDGVSERLVAAKNRGVDEVILANIEKKWPIKDNSYEVVISNQVIEHIVDIDLFISEIKRILKPNGYVVISTENLASWHNIFALILGFQDFSHHLIKKAHVGNPLSQHFGEKTVTWSAEANSGVDDTKFPHIKIPTLISLINILKVYDFKLIKKAGSGYYPLFGAISHLFSRIDPYHSHFITIKMVKPNKLKRGEF
jgi:ubiquinone/menaquinone biosynthesis C-methylase UbiE